MFISLSCLCGYTEKVYPEGSRGCQREMGFKFPPPSIRCLLSNGSPWTCASDFSGVSLRKEVIQGTASGRVKILCTRYLSLLALFLPPCPVLSLPVPFPTFSCFPQFMPVFTACHYTIARFVHMLLFVYASIVPKGENYF